MLENEIIKINYDSDEPTVSARDLHEVLDVSKRFSAWFETNSKGFVEGEDFKGAYLKVQGNQYGGEQELQDYNMTVDMAKHLCLMSRTEKGKECRQYLIDLEKAWNTPEQVMARALKMANNTIDSLKNRCNFLGEQVIEKQMQIEEMQPKATYYDLILQCKDLVSTTVVAKDYGMSAAKFNNLLHENGIQFKQGGVWVLYRDYDHFGYTSTKTHNYSDSVGVQHSKPHMYWTQKGRLFLYDFLKNIGIVPMIESIA